MAMIKDVLINTYINTYTALLKEWGQFKNELTINFKGKELKFSTLSDTSKQWFYPRYISGKRVHEPLIAELISENVNPSDIFFDIGANLGFFTILASRFCNHNGEVHSFEMDPALIPLIEQSIRLNHNSPKIFINCIACTNKSGRLCQFAPQQVDNPSTNRLRNMDRVVDDLVYAKNVLSISVDDYCKQTNTYPDFMKVDIEGGEVFAIPGMLETLKKSKPKVILEIHPNAISHFGSTIDNVVAPFFDLGYKAHIIKSYRDNIGDTKISTKLSSYELTKINRCKPNVLFIQYEEN